MDTSEIYAKLCAPFPKGEEKVRKGPGGKMLTYIDARAVMHRLDETVGPDHWQSKMVQINGNVACELSILYAHEWITKTDGAGETDIEGEKGSFSDAFKRAAVHHGIGRYLYGGPPRSTSVVSAVLEGVPASHLRQDKIADAVAAMKDGLISDDKLAVYEAWSTGLTQMEQVAVWGNFNAADRKWLNVVIKESKSNG